MRYKIITTASGAVAVSALAASVVLASGSHGAETHKPPAPLTPQQLAATTAPGVVEVIGKRGTGSAFVLDAARGLLVTNAHVIAGESSVKVAFKGRQPEPVRVLGQATCEDVAVLQLVSRPGRLYALPLGSSAGIRVGDHVTAFGFPTSLEDGTAISTLKVTDGRVSAANVGGSGAQSNLPNYASTIQHQAPINPGNSGGPLVDDRGRVVGINTIGGGADGEAYAISIDRIRGLLPQLTAGHNLGYLGIQTTPARDVPWAEQYGEAAAEKILGALAEADLLSAPYITHVDEDSPASKAKTKVYAGDLLTRINGEPVASVADVCDIAQSQARGDQVRLSGIAIDSYEDFAHFGEAWSTNLRIEG